MVPIIISLAALYLLISPFWREPVETTMALVFILVGIPVYIIFVWWERTKHVCDGFCGKFIRYIENNT